MTTSTLSTIKAELYSIANRYHLDVETLVADGADRRFKQTWLDAVVQANHQASKIDEENERLNAELQDEAINEMTEANEAEEVQKEIECLEQNALAVQLLSAVQTNGGFTYWCDQKDRTSGFSVGNNTYSYQIPNVSFDNLSYDRFVELVEAIETFTESAESLNNKDIYPNDGIGGWLDTDTNTLYLDAVRHIPNLGDALELALDNRELAIYAIASNICYNVHGSHNKIDENLYFVDGEPSEISDNFLWYRVMDLETDAVKGYVAQG